MSETITVSAQSSRIAFLESLTCSLCFLLPSAIISYIVILFTSQMEEFEHRPYQHAIIDVCIKRNSIVYLPTGAGKSYIAIQVIKHFASQLER